MKLFIFNYYDCEGREPLTYELVFAENEEEAKKICFSSEIAQRLLSNTRCREIKLGHADTLKYHKPSCFTDNKRIATLERKITSMKDEILNGEWGNYIKIDNLESMRINRKTALELWDVLRFKDNNEAIMDDIIKMGIRSYFVNE